METQNILEGNECGIMATSKEEVREGDILITFTKEIQ